MNGDEPVPGIPGAFIRRVGELPATLPEGEAAGFAAEARPGQLLFVVEGTGRFRATGGALIEFVADPGADEGKLRLFLLGTARGALIHQRGELPLHAATLVPPGRNAAIAICGPSGAGKSTLAAELSRRGWVLVADDTTRITWNGGEAVAWPSRDSIKLWRDAFESSGIDVSRLERVARDLDKYYVRVPARDTPVKLGAIAELAADGSGSRQDGARDAQHLPIDPHPTARHAAGPRAHRREGGLDLRHVPPSRRTNRDARRTCGHGRSANGPLTSLVAPVRRS